MSPVFLTTRFKYVLVPLVAEFVKTLDDHLIRHFA